MRARTRGNVRKTLLGLAAVGWLPLATPVLAVTNSITSVSPANGMPGTTNLFVVFTLSSLPPPPGTNVNLRSVVLGTNVGTSVTHTSPAIVTARFSLPESEPAGPRDAVIDFRGPSNDVYYVKSGAFVVLSTQVVYVAAANTNGPWTGRSWATAYGDLQTALIGALGAVWVAEGTYTPTTEADRTASFALKAGVMLYGGFAGTETNVNQRDRTAHPTVLSGDIGVPGNASDNVYHVLVGASGTTLDGFTISAGNANGKTYNGFGGGLVNYNGASPSLRNCTFVGNDAHEGGAVYNYNDSCPLIVDCAFVSNSANKGGAVVNRDGSNSTLSNCVFTGNTAAWRGGAVFNDYGASPVLTGCAFTNNSTPGHGGAIYTDDTASQIGFTSPTISNCTFFSNTAAFRGGAVANYNKCTPAIRACTFVGNAAGTGGGAVANDYGVTATLSGNSYVANSGGSGQADVDTDSTSKVQ